MARRVFKVEKAVIEGREYLFPMLCYVIVDEGTDSGYILDMLNRSVYNVGTESYDYVIDIVNTDSSYVEDINYVLDFYERVC